jgi:peptide/nickel transport system permease protein
MLASIFLVLPALPLLIVIFGLLGRSNNPNDLLIGVIIAVTGWAFGARQLRAETLSMRARDFIDSAKIIGERSWRIMAFEILPRRHQRLPVELGDHAVLGAERPGR